VQLQHVPDLTEQVVIER